MRIPGSRKKKSNSAEPSRSPSRSSVNPENFMSGWEPMNDPGQEKWIPEDVKDLVDTSLQPPEEKTDARSVPYLFALRSGISRIHLSLRTSKLEAMMYKY